MANTLRFKRGLASGLPTGVAGEPLFTTDTFDLYIGTGAANQRYQKYIASGTTLQYLRGDGSLATFPTNIITGTGVAGQVAYWSGASTQTGSNNLFWDITNGRLGIGTNSPNKQLTIAQSFPEINLRRSDSASPTAAINFTGNDNVTKWQLATNVNVGGAHLEFNTTSTLMLLRTNGNLLLGSTTDNGLRFQVTGDGYFSGSVTGAFYKSTNGTVETVLSYSSTPAGVIGTLTNHPLEIYTNGSSKATFTASGNLGLGVTPSAWWSSAKAIQVGTIGSLWSGGGLTNVSHNYYFNGSQSLYLTSAHASAYQQTSGQHIWYNAPSGTAGNAVLFTQAMTLTAAGRLLLGSTSDTSELLQVNGTMKVTGQLTLTNSTSSPSLLAFTNTVNGFAFGFNSTTTQRFVFINGGIAEIASISGTGAGIFNDSVTANLGLYARASGVGYVSLLKGNATNTGFLEFYSAANVRQAYIGFSSTTATSDAGTLPYVAGTHAFSGAATFSSSVTAASLGVNVSTIRTRSEISAILAAPTALNTNVSSGNLLLSDGGNIGLVMGLYNTSFDSYIQARNNLGSNNVAYSLLLNPLGGNVGINRTSASYALDVTGEARVSSAIAIGTTPDTNKPFKILKNINATVGINFENTSTSSLAFSAIQMGTDVTGGTAFTNLVYGSSGITQTGVYHPNGTSLINNGGGGLNFLGTPTRFYTGGSNGIVRLYLDNNGLTQLTATTPTTSETDGYRQYSADVVAGNAAPHFRTENGGIIKLYQETTGVGNAIFSQGGGTGVLDDSTFDGYTLRQIVKALRNQGILA